jgi:hypothetical protein
MRQDGPEWNGGFWPGLLWLTASATGEGRYAEAAGACLGPIRARTAATTILRGFMFWYGAALPSGWVWPRSTPGTRGFPQAKGPGRGRLNDQQLRSLGQCGSHVRQASASSRLAVLLVVQPAVLAFG